jgi:dihydrofolate reductase
MITALFAVDDIGGMGFKGQLSWPHNKDDMTWFKTQTQNEIVVMGRKTWDSPDMPKPLPGRFNVIFTNNFFDSETVEQVRGDVCEALKALKHHHKKKKNICYWWSEFTTTKQTCFRKSVCYKNQRRIYPRHIHQCRRVFTRHDISKHYKSWYLYRRGI